MNAPTRFRLLALVVAFLAFRSFLESRDLVGVLADLPRADVKVIVSQLEEWSAPKLSREIVIRELPGGRMSGWVKESDDSWSVTVFTNVAGSWHKNEWMLVEKDSGKLPWTAP
jgi:hypothetical protein